MSDLLSTTPEEPRPPMLRPVRPRWTQLVWYLTLRELRSRYKRTALGWTWSLLNPLFTALILSAVFGTIFRVEPPVGDPSGLTGFTFYLLAALLPWNMFAACLNNSMSVIVNNAGLIQKVNFPLSSLVWSTCCSAAVTLSIEMGVLTVLIWTLGDSGFPVTVWIVPAVVLCLGVFSAGFGMALATANVYFRDVAYLISVILTAWFYLTPVVYTLDLVPDTWTVLDTEISARAIVENNPLTRYVGAMRDVMYDFRAPSLGTWAWLVGMAAAAFLAGTALFRSFENRFAEEL